MYSAADVVGWYNGDPRRSGLKFDLSPQRVAVVGVGDVALDVSRILCRSADDLERTDIADYAMRALHRSSVREVQVLGRRGPVQAAFSLPVLRELARLPDVQVRTLPDEVELDPISEEQLRSDPAPSMAHKVELLQQMAAASPDPQRSRQIILRFLISPVAVLDDGAGGVGGIETVHNVLVEKGGRVQAMPTERRSVLPVGAIFSAIGYQGVALADVGFEASRGIIPNHHGRVLNAAGTPLPGEYVAGWIKRGPTGLIGTCKGCAAETVSNLLADARAGQCNQPDRPDPQAMEQLIMQRQPRHFTYSDWNRIDDHERHAGEAVSRPRIKLTSVAAMWQMKKQPSSPYEPSIRVAMNNRSRSCSTA